jgi:alpha-mannosidase
LDFHTEVEWNERHTLLKVAFPVDLLATQASYEIPWGQIQRNTHRNTSWDWAQFEVPAQKWADLSEENYGVSLLNDCKYGYDIQDNVIRLTLLRGSTEPDPNADLGFHNFTYSLLPHVGPLGILTLREAYALNDPLLLIKGSAGDPLKADKQTDHQAQIFARTDRENVIIETIKPAEDGCGFIIRIFESQRRREHFTLETLFPIAEAWFTNLLEENISRVEVDGHKTHLFIKPFEIITLRVLPGDILK